MTGTTGRSRRQLLYILLLALVLWLGWQVMFPTQVAAEPTSRAGAILVRFAPGTSFDARQAVLNRLGGSVEWIGPLGVARVRPSTPTATRTAELASLLADLRSRPEILYAEPDGWVQGVPMEMEAAGPNGTIPATPGQPVQVNDPDLYRRDWVYAPWLIHAPEAWSYTMGSPDVVVAIVDSGINLEHPDLRDRIVPGGYDFVDDDADPTDRHGHGTHVAGIVAATANNGQGSAGVCPNCSLLPIRVLDEYNVGTWFDVAAGIVHAVDQGARIVNLSLGGTDMPQVMADAIQYAVDHQVLVVAAAGNGRTNTPFFPAADPRVVAVGATRDDDTLWSLSNYGDWVEVTAPGYAIYSTYSDLTNTYGGYNFMSGTSMAAPHVAGVAGLLFGQDPGRTPEQVRELLRTTAVDLGDTGRDNRFGYGRVDALQALAAGAPPAPTPGSLAGRIQVQFNRTGVRGLLDQVQIEVRAADGTPVAQSHPDGSDGRWRVDGLAPGQYTVYPTVATDRVAPRPASYTVDLAPGETLEGLDFTLEAQQPEPSTMTYRSYIPQVQR